MRQESWCLLIHQVPARPLYLRARVLKRLVRSGAVAIKKSVYALPLDKSAIRRLQTIAAEIRDAGGEAFLCEARFTERTDHDAIVDAFRAQRSAEFRRLAHEVSALADAPSGASTAGGRARRVAALRRRFDWIRSVDPFCAPGADEVATAIRKLDRSARSAAVQPRPAPTPWVGRSWVTRKGVHVDRIACAWVVRRFLDPNARFRFATDRRPRPGELGFDMPGGAFTHERDRCSLEVLLERTGLRDTALDRIAEIVHDLDLKDGRFGHPEAAGIERLMAGMLAGLADDAARLERGFVLFDDLYRSLAKPPSISLPAGFPAGRPKPRGRR